MGQRVVIETAAAPTFEPSFMCELSSHHRSQLALQAELARGRWTAVLERFSSLRRLATLSTVGFIAVLLQGTGDHDHTTKHEFTACEGSVPLQ